MMRLKRIKWKRQPSEMDIQMMEMCTIFGPSVFQRGDEWLFVMGDGMCHASTPDGYVRLN